MLQRLELESAVFKEADMLNNVYIDRLLIQDRVQVLWSKNSIWGRISTGVPILFFSACLTLQV